MPERAATQQNGNRFFEPLFLIVTAVIAYHFYKLRFLVNDGFPPPSFFDPLTAYEGQKPWQYRVLILFVANTLEQLKLPFLATSDRIYRVLEGVSLFFLVLAFRRYISLFLKGREIAAIFSLLILFVLPFHYFFPRPYYPNYWYDTPSMLFFTIGLVLMHQKKWPMYYAVFLLATLNRETTCFLIGIYFLTSIGKEKWGRLIGHAAAQMVIWMAIKWFFLRWFANNPGSDGVEWYDRPGITHFSDNLSYFKNIKNYPAFASVMGFLWIPVVFYFHLIKAEFVKRSLFIFFPFFLGMLFVANIYELRIFNELIPVFLAAFVLIVHELMKRSARSDIK
jgi:hypothetical protein